MFKAFKKKSKPPVIPTFGSNRKSKSVFSLNRSVDKRGSVSSVALDRENPVQTISLHYQHGSVFNLSSGPLDGTNDNNIRQHGFSSFVSDIVPEDGQSRRQNNLDRSRSAGDLDKLGKTDQVYILENDSSAALFLEQLHTDNQGRHPVTGFSTFKAPDPNAVGSASGYISGNLSGEAASFGTNIPVPEAFADPNTDLDCNPHLPPEFDNVSVGTSQYEASVIMPPKGFSDTITESDLQITKLSDGESCVDKDSISVTSSHGEYLENFAEESGIAKKESEHPSKSVSHKFSSNQIRGSQKRIPSQCTRPVLPPKPSVINNQKYKPGYKSYGLRLVTAESGNGCVKVTGISVSEESNSSIVINESTNICLESGTKQTAEVDDEIMLNGKTALLIRNPKDCTTENKLLVDTPQVQMKSETTSEVAKDNLNDDSPEMSDSCSSSVPPGSDKTKHRMSKGVHIMQGPMVCSLREHLKQSSFRMATPSRDSDDEVIKPEHDISDNLELSYKTDTKQPTTDQSSTYLQCQAAVTLHDKQRLVGQQNHDESNEGCSGSDLGDVNTTLTELVDTSSHLSVIPSPKTCDNFISDSFLNDTNFSSYEQNHLESSDSDSEHGLQSKNSQHHQNIHLGDNSELDLAVNDSINVKISGSFLNDTTTPLLNASIHGTSSKMDDTVIIEEDYTPPSLKPISKNHSSKESPPDQPWELSMAMSWGLTKLVTPISDGVLDTYPESNESVESGSTIAKEDGKDLHGVYRWQLKPVSLWDTEDVCQWLESRELSAFNSLIQEKEFSGMDLLNKRLTDLGDSIGDEKKYQKLLHDVHSLREVETKSQCSSVKEAQINGATEKELSSVSLLNEEQPLPIENFVNLDDDEQPETSFTKKSFLKLPVAQWSTNDVVAWLESVGMEKFSPAFKAQGITGEDIVSIDMELLDSLGISSVQDRELILSRLYELQHPDSDEGQITRIKEIFQKVPSFESDKESDTSSNSDRRKVIIDEEKTIDESICVQNLKIWHDVKGLPMDTSITVTPQMRSSDVIIKVLREIDVHEEPGVFTLTRVTMDASTDIVYTSQLSEEDHPSIIHKKNENSDIKARLEMRSDRTNRVKVIFDLDKEISTLKRFDVSSMCTCGELLNIAVSALCLGDVSDYCLQAVDDTGVLQPVGITKLLLLYKCEAYKLMKKQSALETPQKSIGQIESISNKHKTRIWQKDHNSDTKFAKRFIVMEHEQSSVTGTDILLDPDLTTLTDDLETLSALSDNSDPLSHVTCSCNHPDVGTHYNFEPTNVFTFHSRAVSVQKEEVTELREGLMEKDKLINRLQLENEVYQADSRQAHDLRSLFSVMEREMKQGQAELLNKYKMLEQQLTTVRDKSRGILGHEDEVDILQHILIVTSQQIQLTEQREKLLQAQLATAQANLKPDPPLIQQLKHQLSDTDSSLLDLKQQQADIYRQMKLARRQLAKMYKTSVDVERFCIYKLLQELGYSPSIIHQVVTLTLDMSSNRCDFILGLDSHNRPLVKHANESSLLQKGDRIIEVNGMSVTHLNQSELSKHLQAVTNLTLVILRMTPNYELKVQEKIEEADSIREDLSLTMLELDALQKENEDMKYELERLTDERVQLQQKHLEMETKMEELNAMIEQQRHEVQAQVEQFKEQLQKKEEEIQNLKSQTPAGVASDLKTALQGISRRSSVLSRLSDSGMKSVINGNAGDSQSVPQSYNGDKVLSYEDYGEVPIWQSLQLAPKSDILQALKDQVLENQQQKAYLDHLLTAVIDNAPNLVQVVDQCIGVLDHNALELKTRSEEFC